MNFHIPNLKNVGFSIPIFILRFTVSRFIFATVGILILCQDSIFLYININRNLFSGYNISSHLW